MDKSLLAVRNINHKYIVVGKEEASPAFDTVAAALAAE